MGAYITNQNLYDKFGKDNIAIWSNMDNLTDGEDQSRIDYAIAIGEEYVQDRFRNSRYTVPFQGQPMPLWIKEWMTIKAGEWLYESRGTRDGGPNADFENRIAALASSVDEQIDQVLSGQRELTLAQNWPTATAPNNVCGWRRYDRRWPGQI